MLSFFRLEKTMQKRILVVVTSIEKYPNLQRPTGLWLGEAVHFIDKVESAGYPVDLVSPKGGYTPIDPHSLELAEPIDWEWYAKKSFMNRLGATLAPAAVNASTISPSTLQAVTELFGIFLIIVNYRPSAGPFMSKEAT